MVQHNILMNESQEVGGLRNLLAAADCQTSAAEKKTTTKNKNKKKQKNIKSRNK